MFARTVRLCTYSLRKQNWPLWSKNTFKHMKILIFHTFCYRMTRYCSRLVVYHVNTLLNELRHPPGHDLHQRPQAFRVSHPIKPEHFDGLLQLGYACEGLAVELFLHPNPAILNRVKVRLVSPQLQSHPFFLLASLFCSHLGDRKNRELKLASTGKFWKSCLCTIIRYGAHNNPSAIRFTAKWS